MFICVYIFFLFSLLGAFVQQHLLESFYGFFLKRKKISLKKCNSMENRILFIFDNFFFSQKSLVILWLKIVKKIRERKREKRTKRNEYNSNEIRVLVAQNFLETKIR